MITISPAQIGENVASEILIIRICKMTAQLITGSDRFRFQMLNIFYQIINQLTEFVLAIAVAAVKAIILINHGLHRFWKKS
jgi:hypothetical protein